MSGHTPGPWSLGDENDACCSVDTGRSSISLDRMDVLGRTADVISRDEMLANARLIAAAPDLLDALRTLRHSVVADNGMHDGSGRTVAEFIDTAIAKAEGKL